ncbi:exonuclease domain-containing protein [Alteromonas sp. ASW11-130]|uniref:exonuclease domain-containing protein n=1 Tax=Alteromonas sp. ASW11-130 TaxID=3015775 RepID=UPI002241E0AD|nr:exonuclease domain-containing protein [Alteromonas sp. ASW11-130]MCW8093245.1 exonuclease domain-containing protein [Alteromonas sp. ASW11-130]
MRKTLPTFYYLTHFHEFLSFFDGVNSALLDETTLAFIAEFRALSHNQQCIIARAANRKYAVINRYHFNYEEIADPQLRIDELVEQQWFCDLSVAKAQDVAAVMVKNELISLVRQLTTEPVSASLKKSQLSQLLMEQVALKGWPETFSQESFLVRAFDHSFRYLLFVYFGHTNGRLNQFSLRDLGVMRTRSDNAFEQLRFSNKDDAQAAFFYAMQLEQMPFWHQHQLNTASFSAPSEAQSLLAVQWQEKYQYALSMQLLSVDYDTGLRLLANTPGDKAKEKWIREAYKHGQKEKVKAELENIIDSPPSDTLLNFAEDFLARKYMKKRTSALTDMLRAASRTLKLDISQNASVESGVMALYRRQGITAYRTENQLWRSLFGLIFWQILFEQDEFVNEFDRRPVCLKENTFYQRYHTHIEATLAQVNSLTELKKHLLNIAGSRYGQPNALFIWSHKLLEPINALLEHCELSHLFDFLRMMCRDFHSLQDGFPDIMVIEHDVIRFEEIKAPGDQLRRNQLISIQRLQQAGFTVQISAVEWYFDPAQPYVVVDIETTGGKAEHHRITEIGMIKLIGGEEVDRWQSLLNPQRRIPFSITELTGITNEMVAEAPLFAEIAHEIDEFTQDCVFVAHNVNFDYGFIRQEFARLELPFRRAKLCTVREMRKVNPGLRSYSLAALTQTFDIKMDRHHRALSDAKAAAELLKIVLQKRGNINLS